MPTHHQADWQVMNVVVLNTLMTYVIRAIAIEKRTRLGLWVLEAEDKAASYFEVQIRFGFQHVEH